MEKRRLIDANSLKEVLNMSGSLGYIHTLQDVFDQMDIEPTIDPETLRPVSEWELNPDRWTCEWFRCKKCHYTSCSTDPFCGGCGAKMKNAGASTDDLNEPKEETFDMG